MVAQVVSVGVESDFSASYDPLKMIIVSAMQLTAPLGFNRNHFPWRSLSFPLLPQQ